MKSPTDVLRDEHAVILRALDVLEAAARRLTSGAALPDRWWPEIIDWLRGFADRNHHAKEERALFPAMVKAGVPEQGGPIGVMLAEHAEGRALIQAMATEPATPGERAASAQRYVQLLRAHIAKENDVLFMIADSVLEPATQAAVAREFDALADEVGRDSSIRDAEERLAALARVL